MDEQLLSMARDFAAANKTYGTVSEQTVRRLYMDVLLRISTQLKEQNDLLKEDEGLLTEGS